MPALPSRNELRLALKAAANAHHEFQENALNGVRHEKWAMWYAAYVLGRLGDFTTPTLLTQWLSEVEGERWFSEAPLYILDKLEQA